MEASFTPNVQLSEFALKLRRYRRENMLRYDDVASLFGVSEERLFSLETDKERPTLREKRLLAKLLAKQKTASTK